jgi:hypothetical protein
MIVARITIEVHDDDRIDVAVAGKERINAGGGMFWKHGIDCEEAIDMVRKRLPGAQVDAETGERF